MDFLKALKEAKELGVAEKDFMRIWEQEMKLKQEEKESRTLELKLACGKIQDQDSSESKSVKDQGNGVQQNHMKEIQQQITELHIHSQHQFQEVSKLLGNQATMTAMMIKNELMGAVMSQFGAGVNSDAFHSVPNALGTFKQKHNLAIGHLESGSLDSAEDDWCIFPTDEGAILSVNDVDHLATTRKATVSPFYVLPNCAGKVQLIIWFSRKGHVKAQISVCGIRRQSLKQARIFTVRGQIKNRNSGSFSSLFEGKSHPVRELKPNKEMIFVTSVCLKTGSGSFDKVTLDELEKRAFVIDNSIVIKWFVTSELLLADEDDE